LLPPCEVEPEFADPSPDVELELVLDSVPVLLDVAVVPLLLGLFDEATATESPVAPIPRTAVASAAADARRNQRGRSDGGSKASVVTMPQASCAARQPHSKRSSSDRQVLLRAV
jgi:hypothetical protein